MSLEDSSFDRCEKPQSEFSALGKEAGIYLSHGDESAFMGLYGKEQAEEAQVAHGNLDLILLMRKDFVLGVVCTDPTDVHLTQHKGSTIDVSAEVLTNRVQNRLDRFSTKPSGDYSHTLPETREEALQAINTALQNPKTWNHNSIDPEQIRKDFIEDFNRRRLENNYLPNFDAYLDPSDKQVKIRYLVQEVNND